MLAPAGYEVPSLMALSRLLRDRKHWPKGFKWNWNHCDSCAIGLMAAKWDVDELMVDEVLGISRLDVCKLFLAAPVFDVTPTPEHVADRIDKFLNKEL